MRHGLARGLLFGLPVACALWAAILVPLILWGWHGEPVGLIGFWGGVLARGVLSAAAARRKPKPDYITIDRLERELGMQHAAVVEDSWKAQVTYHGHAGPCTDACPRA